jgi:hypothetical protein
MPIFDKLLEPVVNAAAKYAGTIMSKAGSSKVGLIVANCGKAIIEHIGKHKTIYTTGAVGAGLAGAAGAGYKVGEIKGHTDGKKEGIAEEAAREEKKFQLQHQQHEDDRKKWEECDREKDELIGQLSNMHKDQILIISNVNELVNYLNSLPKNVYIYFSLNRAKETDKNLYAIVDISSSGDYVLIETQNERSNYAPHSKEDILEKLEEQVSILGKECDFQVIVGEEMFCVLNIINFVDLVGSEKRYIIELA